VEVIVTVVKPILQPEPSPQQTEAKASNATAMVFFIVISTIERGFLISTDPKCCR
jgi:hypothetical protein